MRPLARPIGERIVELREELGLTQERLAWEAGLKSKSYLSRIEGGDRLPSLEILDKLARRLGVETRDLLIFPSRSQTAEAMEAVRRGGDEFAKKVLALAPGAGAARKKREVAPQAP